MKRTTLGLVALVLLLTATMAFPWQPAHATQPTQTLPPMSWYAVVWDQGADTLHWININGEAASRARPQLPNEAVGSSNPDMRISPNGRYLVETATLNTGLMAVGIFDFQSGNWVQVHIASPGEEINLGSRYIFDPNSTHVAVGFMVADYSAPTWHVSVYDLASGGELAALNSGDVASTTPLALARPFVRYYTVDSAGEAVHIQLIAYGTEGAETWPAYVWHPFAGGTTPVVSPSPYTRANSDINFLTGEEVFAYNDPAFTSLPQIGPGPSYNAIGRAMPGASTITRVWVDGTDYHYNARWAKGSEWALFWTDNGAGQQTWNATYTNVSPNTSTLLGPSVTDVAGTPEGYLKITNTLEIYHVSNLMDYLGGTKVFQASGPGPLRVVYVTPAGATFTLPSISTSPITPGVIITLDPNVLITPPAVPVVTLNPGTIITLPPGALVTIPPFQMGSITCPGAPPARLSVGQQARVTFTNGIPLRVRATPGGDVITQIPEGTVVQVIGGPQCQGQFTWWQIQLDNGIQGWSAEGDMEDYYLEPWATLAPPPQLPTLAPPAIQPTPTSPQLIVPPSAFVTVPPLIIGPVISTEGDCSKAPPTRLQMDMRVITAPTSGTYALFANIEDPTPYRQVPPNIVAQVIGESSCKNGYRFWPVQLTLNGEELTGWLSEGTQDRYFLIPDIVY